MGGLFLVACRSDARGLNQTGPAPSPPVGRQDASSLPVGPVGGTGSPTTPPPDATLIGQTDAPVTTGDAPTSPMTPVPDAAVSTQPDAGATVVDVATSRPPDVSAPVRDTSVVVADATGPPPTSLGPVVRAKEIMADTVVAHVIYVKEIDVEDAQIGTLTETKNDKRWEMGGADTKIDVQNLQADTIYVEKLHARRVEAREVFAEVVKIQRR
jgi:hypothetical protein